MTQCNCLGGPNCCMFRQIPGPSRHCPVCGFWERAGLPHDCDEVIARRTADLLRGLPMPPSTRIYR